jgi:hypothetical protein
VNGIGAKAVWLAAALAGSWPCAVAAVLLRFALRSALLPGRTLRPAFVLGWFVSGVVAAIVAWFGWRSAERAPGLWGLYGALAALPVSSFWAVLGEVRVGTAVGGVAVSAIMVWCYSMPIDLIVGIIVGFQLAHAMSKRGWVGGMLGVSYGVGIAIAVAARL